MDAVGELFEAAAGEIVAADAAAEEDIAAEQHRRAGVANEIDHVPGRVSRQVPDCQRDAGDGHVIAIGQDAVSWRARDRQAER